MLWEMRSEDVEALLSSQAAASPLLHFAVCDCRQGLERKDGDKEGHLSIAFVLEEQHLTLETPRGLFPHAPTYMNQSDKRHTLIASLWLRLPGARKRAFVDSHFDPVFV